MSESSIHASAAAAGPLSTAELGAFRDALRRHDATLNGPERLVRIRLLEELKAAVAAAQALEVSAFVNSRRAEAAAQIASTPRPGAGTRRRIAEAERGITAEVARARRESPAQACRFIGFATSAPAELPKAFTLLARGAVSERRVASLHHATVWLTPDQRREVDRELAPDLTGLGDRELLGRASAAGYRIDPHGSCARVAAAETDRHVSARPKPESMVGVSALLPVVDGVAVWAALDRAARSARAAGDARTRGQVMADTLVERVTGRAKADGVAVEVQLIMTDRVLVGGSDEPVHVIGGGPLPARLGRDLVLSDTAAQRSVRRLFADPLGRLVTMETDARCFTPAMRHFVTVRDRTCRTPWCDAPIRHVDHVDPAAEGGPTALTNARGLCERCNYAAQTRRPLRAGPGSRARPMIDIVWEPGAARAA